MTAPTIPVTLTVVQQRDSVPWYGGVATPISYRRSGSGHKQRRPYNIDTPCTVDTMRRLAGLKDCNGWAVNPYTSDANTAATNKARAKFVAELGQGSQFGATLTAEARKTSQMLTSTVLTVVLSAKAVARGKLGEAAKLLNFYPPEKTKMLSASRRKVKDVQFDLDDELVNRKVNKGRYKKRLIRKTYWVMPNGKEIAKSSANKWLWWSYGVRPLQQDLYNGLDVLQRPLPWKKFSGGGSAKSSGTNGGSIKYEWTCTCKVSAYVTVKNPNLWLANQMGLVNPLQWLNEAVPFSFVLDWFSNWSDVLSQYTDFVGLDIARPITTTYGTVKETGTFIQPYTIQWSRFTRVLSIPTVKLRFAYERFQWQRGANAISLLVGFLRDAKAK